MTSPEARKSAAPALDFSATKAAVWLSATAFLALLVLYFVGMDQGATSVFGSNTVHSRVRARRPPLSSAFPATDEPRRSRHNGKANNRGAAFWPAPCGSVAAFVFARTFVEPLIERAIGYEDGVGAAHEAIEAAQPATSTGSKAGSKVSPAACRPTSDWDSGCSRSASRWARCSRWRCSGLRPRRQCVGAAPVGVCRRRNVVVACT